MPDLIVSDVPLTTADGSANLPVVSLSALGTTGAESILLGGTRELTSDGWKRWIRVRATNGLARYSLRNQWLIALECHRRRITPTYIAGFRAFLQLNRCVRKGERAIRILAPVAVKERDEHGEETGAKRIFFRTGRIFSSASTDPKEHLGHFLVSYGFITEEELSKAIEMQESNQMLLGKILVTIGAVSEPDLQREATKSWADGLTELAEVWADPGGAVRRARRRRAVGEPTFEFVPDMPSAAGDDTRALDEGELDQLVMPTFDTIGHDGRWLGTVHLRAPAHAQVLKQAVQRF